MTAGPSRDPSVPDIRLPAGLLPADGRFGSGPSKVRPEALAGLVGRGAGVLGTSHRQPPVRQLVRRVRAGLADLFGLPDGHEVVLGNGGSTQFWDVAALCLVRRRSQHLVFGEFGAKFAHAVAAAPFLAAPDVLEAPPGSRTPAVARPDVDAYAQVHNETSTGVVGVVGRPAGAADGSLVLVDGTSAAGALPWDPAGVDAYYFAPQKVLASDGGLWVAVLSSGALERVRELAAAGRWVPASLDLAAAVEESRRDQTVNTPAIATLWLLAEQLDWLLAGGGVEFAAGRCARSAAALYGWAERRPWARPFVADEAARSPVVGTVDLDPSVPAATVAAVLRANGVVDTEPYRKLGRNQLRIGMYPAVDPEDVEALTACIDHVVAAL